jgi:Flp pilus assembly protein TadG
MTAPWRGQHARRVQRGATAVEFALLAPILFLLVVGLLQWGLYFWAAQGGSNAAREAARRAAVGDLTACADFQGYVRDRIDALGDTDAAVISRTYSNGPTPNVAANLEVGDVVTVSVTFDAVDLNLPLIPYSPEVTQEAEARVESVPDDTAGNC